MRETSETLPPEGYQLLYAFRYPKTFTYLAFLLYTLFFLAFYVIWKFVRHSFFSGVPGDMVYWIVVLSLPMADIVRALIQRGVSRFLGYGVSLSINGFGFLPETYTAEPGQFQKRDHVLLIAVAPLSVFVLLMIPLFIFMGTQEAVGDALAFFLFVSIARTVGDLYFIWRLLRMPRGTLLYNVNLKEKLILKPIE